MLLPGVVVVRKHDVEHVACDALRGLEVPNPA
jgi:hypothetical protein